ncbi:MAG: amidohydrolase family protein [Proteobacteria bacterium]|nr:amidohydrolase family protein [Pseudomonadota bacterium]
MIIDMDTHILPRDVYDHMEGPTADLRPRFEYDKDGLLVKWSFPGEYRVKGSTPLPPPGAGGKHLGLSNMDVRLEEYQKLGIDKQLLLSQFSAIYFNYTLDPALAIQMAHSHNIAILNLIKKYPNELIGAALVAMQDVPTAISEMEWAKKNGFQAIAMDKVFPVREHQFSETLGSHRELWPFFKRAEELGMPIVLHNVQHGHRISNMMIFQRDGLDTLCPAEGQMSLASLCTSGLFDDFPNLKMVFTEAGSAFIKPLLDRLDAAFVKPPLNYEDEDATARFLRRVMPVSERLSAGKRLTSLEEYEVKNKKPVSEYFKKNLFFTIETEEPELPESIEMLGATQFLFATDYPHDDPGGRMKYKDVQLLRDNPRITEEAKDIIRSTSAAAMLPALT